MLAHVADAMTCSIDQQVFTGSIRLQQIPVNNESLLRAALMQENRGLVASITVSECSHYRIQEL